MDFYFHLRRHQIYFHQNFYVSPSLHRLQGFYSSNNTPMSFLRFCYSLLNLLHSYCCWLSVVTKFCFMYLVKSFSNSLRLIQLLLKTVRSQITEPCLLIRFFRFIVLPFQYLLVSLLKLSLLFLNQLLY